MVRFVYYMKYEIPNGGFRDKYKADIKFKRL